MPSRSLLPGSACRSMWCSRPVFIRVGGLSRARRGTDIHGEWRPLFSFCQRAPRLSSPPLTGGVWKAGVRSLRHEPCESPPALPAVVRGGSREARQGLRRLPPLARFAPPTVCGPCGPPPSEPGEGWPMCAASHALPERALCARVSRSRSSRCSWSVPGRSSEVPGTERRRRFPFLRRVCPPARGPAFGGVPLRRCVRVGVEASGKKEALCVRPPLRERGTMNRLSRAPVRSGERPTTRCLLP